MIFHLPIEKLKHHHLFCLSYLVECHCFYIERSEDCFFVYHGRIISNRDLGRQNDAHVTEVDVDCSQISSAHGTAMKDGDLRQGWYSLPLSINIISISNDNNVLQLMISKQQNEESWCGNTIYFRLLALRGMIRFLRPIRGLSCSAKRHTTTWLLCTMLAISCLLNKHFSMLLAGHQWKTPVLS